MGPSTPQKVSPQTYCSEVEFGSQAAEDGLLKDPLTSV